jgi:cytidyltransferase-like protein
MELARLLERRAGWRRAGAVVVFTNGCFDLLHRGHVDFLARARALGRPTTVKTRVVALSSHVVRVDEEDRSPVALAG